VRGEPAGCCSCLRTVKLRTAALAALACLLALPIGLYWLHAAAGGARQGVDSADTARRVLGLIDFDHLSGPEIQGRIEELLRIKGSVQAELRGLEQRRAGMQAELAELASRTELVRMESSRETKELERLRVSIQQVKVAQQEYIQRNTPDIAPPLPLLPGLAAFLPPPAAPSCSLATCTDFSRCSVSSRLPVYVYPSEEKDRLALALGGLRHRSPAAETACLLVAVLPAAPASLDHWAGDGRNHLLLHRPGAPPVPWGHTGRAMIASPLATAATWRPGFDLVLPSLAAAGQGWGEYPALAPITRPALLTFAGQQGAAPAPGALGDALAQDREVVAALKDMTVAGTSDKFTFTFSCASTDATLGALAPTDWALCGTAASRGSALAGATFALVLPPSNRSLLSTAHLQARLVEALLAGAVPVILSTDLLLPYGEVVDWSRAAVLLPTQRVTELHFLLRTLHHSDVFAMKRQGRLILQTYLSSPSAVLDTLVAVVRQRLTIPALPWTETPSPSVFNSSFTPKLMEHLPLEVEPDESLGPLEPPFPSPAFRRNFSSVLLHSSHQWNTLFSPHLSAPHTPWEPLLPTEAKFLGPSLGFRPVSGGQGGAGAQFSQAIGGNSPQEQFTVVMLTYQREQVLLNSLARLYGLPYLNKVVVVWNSPEPPAEDLQWPDIGVPIHVVRTEKNSLNNRFLPYSAIETEAVLSVDDDAHLRHDEIVFGFRVWRENRERLVGFPGRFHAWDAEHNSWNYNSNYSCELSMVLTGAAFYHKYYSYVYTHVMAAAVREAVDEFTNCEDLAMNFLVAHLTRRPPVKVTSRWTFRCPGCPVSLSEDDSHFQERHACLNLFTRVYGYMPLLYTQYRADSVLFKTRIPPDKQKCFKFI